MHNYLAYFSWAQRCLIFLNVFITEETNRISRYFSAPKRKPSLVKSKRNIDR